AGRVDDAPRRLAQLRPDPVARDQRHGVRHVVLFWKRVLSAASDDDARAADYSSATGARASAPTGTDAGVQAVIDQMDVVPFESTHDLGRRQASFARML